MGDPSQPDRGPASTSSPDDDKDLDTLTERGSDVLLGASTRAQDYTKGDKDDRDNFPGYGWDD